MPRLGGFDAMLVEHVAIEIRPIFGETLAPPEPCGRSFDDPPLREGDKSFCVIGALDDLPVHVRLFQAD